MKERFETFTVLVNKINRNIRKIKKRKMAGYNLKSQHISCLYYLYNKNGLTATELCEKCAEDKATISRALDFLEKGGYLICKSKHEKRYKSPLTLTVKGREVGKNIACKVNEVLDEISTCLTDDERNDFYRFLNLISRGLDAVAGE